VPDSQRVMTVQPRARRRKCLIVNDLGGIARTKKTAHYRAVFNANYSNGYSGGTIKAVLLCYAHIYTKAKRSELIVRMSIIRRLIHKEHGDYPAGYRLAWSILLCLLLDA
jgi:hypothetical protein